MCDEGESNWTLSERSHGRLRLIGYQVKRKLALVRTEIEGLVD